MTTDPSTSSTVAETRIEADPALPTITMTRDFAARIEDVFRAWVDPDLFAQWIGPHGLETRIDHWDARTGGSWRCANLRDGEQIASFYGSFHEVRPHSRLVQTFTYDGAPDGVSLETMTFTDLGGGRTRTVGLSVVASLEIRDMILASGMEAGVREGYEKLDALLAR